MTQAPFPYFGGKASVADIVWAALDDVKHYIEPFFGSGAVLLARPDYQPGVHIESVNDADGFICNVWRALQANPDEVAKWCDWPVNHCDLSARKLVLNREGPRLTEQLIADEAYFDPKLAGYWIWAASCWIGRGLTRIGSIPNLGSGGMGVHKMGQIPRLTGGGMGVHKVSTAVSPDATRDVREPYSTNLYVWFRALSERLRYVRVVCGDWTRVCGGDWQDKKGTVGMFFDPPYSHDAGRDNALYGVESDCAKTVAKWCAERGGRESYRIVLAGYEGEHGWLENEGWRAVVWKARGGYGHQAVDGTGMANRHRERLWLSPHCIGTPTAITLFEA